MKIFYALPLFLGLALSQIGCSQNSGTSTANNAGNAVNAAVSNVQAVAPAKEKSTKPEDYPNLKQQADEMGEAFLSKNHEKFADYMHPELMRMIGGKEKFLQVMDSADKMMDSNKIEVSKYQVEPPTQILEHENGLYAVLPTTLVMKSPEMKEPLTDQGALLAASSDEGKNWKFVRVESKSKLKIIFPTLVDKLSLPASIQD
jgi:hypothetical protein